MKNRITCIIVGPSGLLVYRGSTLKTYHNPKTRQTALLIVDTLNKHAKSVSKVIGVFTVGYEFWF